ncbi:SDR family oxidoreductase [Salinicola sp. JS01]|uniref:SDR family NAD(P)-dependent oxidoreductase n=1 Tax=Salinicola sp. JS01 TaxID=3050071 RepID=UPI00255B5EB5|nr:SDR family oxidoreductase [Salinicola sp. JS01]WIX34403.1 SDR family oxidoreductase [Salinicola sp. JS01]
MSSRRVAIVTGGGTGIGAATAQTLASADWNVVICGRRMEPLQKIAECTGALPIVADASCEKDIQRLVTTTTETFGRLDGVVLNAGVVRPGSVGELSDDDWQAMVDINLSGPFKLLRAALPHLIAARGAVVGVASAAALRATNEIPGYNATKAGLNMLLQSVAVDYGPRGVRANTVCPGWVRTEMADMEMQEYGESLGLDREQAYARATALVPARRPATAEEVADVIAWLLSDKARYVSAAVLPVDGGMIATDPGAIAFDPRISFQ